MKNVEYLNSLGKKVKPLYTEQQMHQMFNHMEAVNVDEKIVIDDNLTVVLHHNNHVVGATSISLYIKKSNNSVKHILYSSDMGNTVTQDLKPFLKKNELPNKCNLFISEATYNNPDRCFTKKDAIKEREELAKNIKQWLNEDRRILFATFSFARTQEILAFLYQFKDEEWFEDVPIVCDGLLMNNINAVYHRVLDEEDADKFREIMSMKNIKINKNYDSTIACLSKRTKGIYLASSGFCTAGRILTYLPQFLGSKKDVVILTGYCGSEDSIGGKILSEQKTVTIDKQVVYKKAIIKQLKTWSSHVGYWELLNIFENMRCDKILIHHCDDGKDNFCEKAKEYLRSKGITTPVVPVNKGANQFVL